MLTESNKTTVRRLFEELWNEGPFDNVSEFFAPDCMNFCAHQNVGDIVRGVVMVWRTAFPDLHFTVDSMVADGDVVMCEVTLKGTHLGGFHLIP